MCMHIVLVDDERLQIEQMTRLIQGVCHKLHIPLTLTTFTSGQAFLFALPDHPEWELVFLDIQMPDLSGMSVAHQIHQSHPQIKIIFATAYADFAVESYQVDAFSYLLKPIQASDIEHVLTKHQNMTVNQPVYLVLSVDGEFVKLDLATIIYVESQGHKLLINTSDKLFESNMTLAQFMAEVDERFVQTHRSYRVNLDFVDSIAPTELLLTTGDRLPIARRQVKQVQRAFIDYFKGDLR